MKPIAWLMEGPPNIGDSENALNVDYDLLAVGYGYAAMGYEVRRLRCSIGRGRKRWDPSAVITRGTPVIGCLDLLPGIVEHLGGTLPQVSSYPAGLRSELGNGPLMTRGVLSEVQQFPVFVKSVGTKVISGFVAESHEDLFMATAHLDENTPVWFGKPFDAPVAAEWRAFMLDNELVHVGQYRGAPLRAWPSSFDYYLRVLDRVGDMPRAYTVDFGLLANDFGVFMECNPAAPAGLYGAKPEIGAALHAATWEEAFGMEPGTLASRGERRASELEP